MDDSKALKLHSARYVTSAFAVFFSKQTMVKKWAEPLGNKLRAHYFPSQEVPVTDDAEPEFPRLLFASQHGFSQIAVSQSNISINVQYSADWQTDLTKGEAYLLERANILFDALAELNVVVLFSGFSAAVRLQSDSDELTVGSLARNHAGEIPVENPHEIVTKVSSVLREQFFRNITIRNYRLWSIGPFQQGYQRLSQKNSTECGLEILIDYNDRYAFNEGQDYFSGQETGAEIVQGGASELRSLVARLEQGQW